MLDRLKSMYSYEATQIPWFGEKGDQKRGSICTPFLGKHWLDKFWKNLLMSLLKSSFHGVDDVILCDVGKIVLKLSLSNKAIDIS